MTTSQGNRPRETMTLEVVGGPHPKGSFEVGSGGVLGRSSDAALKLTDPDVSRHHARLVLEAGGFFIEDLGSRHGTFVDEKRVTRAPLQDGSRVRLGPSTVLRCRRAGFERATSWSDGAGEVVRASCQPETSTLLWGAGGSPEELARAHKKLQLVYAATEALSTVLDADRLVERILDLLFEVVPADRGAVLLLDPRTRELETRVVRSRNRGHEEEQGLVLSGTIVKRVLADRVGLLVDDALAEQSLGAVGSIVSQGIRSALCTPIHYRDQVYGVVYLDTVGSAAAFDSGDLEAVMALSRQAAIRLENARLMERIRDEAVTRSNLQRYLPAHLVDRVFSNEVELKPGGSRAEVTVLFTDLRDFTRNASAMEPEAVIELLNAYFEEMVDCVFKHDGTLDKFIGDALMAVWGGPLPCADGPLAAVSCALEMQVRLQAFNQLHAGRGWPQLAMGVGINTGQALVGNLGSSRRMEYTVLGHTVNMASRLESLNKELGTKVLIGEAVWRRLQERVLAQPKQARVKGVEAPLTVYSVEGLRSAPGVPEERRRSPRVQVALDSPAILALGARRMEGVITSASRTGAGLCLAVPDAGWLEPGQEIELTLAGTDGGPVMQVRGRVVRIAPGDNKAQPLFEVGVDFTDEFEAAEQQD